MQLIVNLDKDEELRKAIRTLIEGEVRGLAREELGELAKARLITRLKVCPTHSRQSGKFLFV